ncbi:hypothetical protein N7G274_003053 [Stereocaulon virgatum]|uniref:DNA polymerase delta subunit 4 n=1 Tax=Stereocaulon virgatum TaxID=373712 RepID=A0ABR4ALP2_9LECA
MPPTRRKAPTTHPRAQQTLAFGPNSQSNKVTKPSIPPTSKKPSKERLKLEKTLAPQPSTPPSLAPEEAAQEAKPETQPPIPESPSTLAIRNQSATKQAEGGSSSSSGSSSRSPVEEKAKKIPEAQIRRYWKAKEDERIAPRVHQQGLSLNEKILRHFDLSSQYGPCVGIPRMRRWKRAEGLGLKPPVEVLAVLMREEGNGNAVSERAFMDGLLTSRLAVNE